MKPKEKQERIKIYDLLALRKSCDAALDRMGDIEHIHHRNHDKFGRRKK